MKPIGRTHISAFSVFLVTLLNLPDKHQICTLSVKIKFMWTRCEAGLKKITKASMFPSKKLTPFTYPEIDGTFPHKYSLYFNFDRVTAVLGLADCLLDKWSNNSIRYGNSKSYCWFPQSFSSVKIQINLLCNDFTHFFDVAIPKNYNISFNVRTSRLEARNLRLVNRIPSLIQESKFIEENKPPNVSHC